MKDERNKLLTFRAVGDAWGSQEPSQNHGGNEQELPPPELRIARPSELNGSGGAGGGGEEEGDKGVKEFCPGWRH